MKKITEKPRRMRALGIERQELNRAPPAPRKQKARGNLL
jgi:hypothetical protein